MTVKKTQKELGAALDNTEHALGGLENALDKNGEANVESNGLPEGWHLVSIDDVTFKGEQRKPEDSEELIYVDIGSIDRNKKIISTPQQLLGKDAPSRARRIISKGDVLVSLTRPNLNAVALVPEKYDRQFASTGFEVLKPVGYDSRLLFSITKSKSFIDSISGTVQGALYPAAKSADVKSYEIPLPPRAEQTVIAQTLDTLLAQVDNIKTRLDAIPKILKTFRQSVLAAAVSGKLTEAWRGENESSYPSKVELDKNIRIARKIKWEERQLASFDRKGTKPKNDSWKKRYKEPLDGYMDEYSMTQIQAIPDEWVESNLDTVSITVTGKTPSTTKEENWNGSLPFISPSQVSKNGEILLSERMVSDLGAMNTPVLPANSILIVCIGTIGKVGLLDREAAFNQQLNALIPVDGMSNMFLYYWSKTLYDWLIKTSSAVVNAAIINKSRLSSAPCPLPSLEEQTQIVRRVEELFTFADQIEQQVKNAQKRVNNLTQSILAKAFRGELTAQWRTENPDLITGDNSAEALLAKIQEEREALKKSSKPKNKTAKIKSEKVL